MLAQLPLPAAPQGAGLNVAHEAPAEGALSALHTSRQFGKSLSVPCARHLTCIFPSLTWAWPPGVLPLETWHLRCVHVVTRAELFLSLTLLFPHSGEQEGQLPATLPGAGPRQQLLPLGDIGVPSGLSTCSRPHAEMFLQLTWGTESWPGPMYTASSQDCSLGFRG